MISTRLETNRLRLQAYELSVLTGTQVLLLVVSETGLVYTFTTPKLQPLVTKAEGKNLIQVRFTWPASRKRCVFGSPRLSEGSPKSPRTAARVPRATMLNLNFHRNPSLLTRFHQTGLP